MVHDYSGHPGQVHLSRELARRGHDVEHQFCSSYTTGRGATERREGDPPTFDVRPITLGAEFQRYSPSKRVRQEFDYSRQAFRAIASWQPDAAVLSNVPLIALFILSLRLRHQKIPFVFWQQDVYSEAIGNVARQKLGRIGSALGWVATRCERSVARAASAIVAISDAFADQLDSWGVDPDKVCVIPNWAAIDEVPSRPRENEWARSRGLVGVPVVMYAGTLGVKHDPSILLELARSAPPTARVIVVSQGMGRSWLDERAFDVPQLVTMDYEPYENLPDMLASADVLVVLLERNASRYSVPSKVLNYLCAGRPILGVLPSNNAVAETIADAGAGIVVEPGDSSAVASALHSLLDDPTRREQMGIAARRYAERVFDVHDVAEQFQAVLARVLTYD